MDYYGAVNELRSIKAELQAVMEALTQVASGIASDFCGIGSEKCAAAMETVLEELCAAQRSLNDVGESTIRGWFDQRRREEAKATDAARTRAEQEEFFLPNRNTIPWGSRGE